MKRSNNKSPEATKLFDHIRELQMRALASTSVLAIAGVLVYCFYGQLLDILRSPLNAPLYYSSPAGSFGFVMKICFMGALTIAIPVIVYNLIMFIRPAYSDHLTKKRVYTTTLFSSLLAISGALFAFYCVLPGTLHFFNGFQVNGLSALISADSYLRFVTNIIITFVLVFQLPLVISLIDGIKPITPKKLFKMEKWIIIASLIISLLAPFSFDVVTSILVAVPIIVLYNLSIIIVLIQHAQAKRKINSIVHANIVVPALNNDEKMPILEDILADDILNEVAELDLNINNSQPSKRAGMEISRPILKPQTVAPAEWVIERNKKRQAMLTQKTNVFSDISRTPRKLASSY